MPNIYSLNASINNGSSVLELADLGSIPGVKPGDSVAILGHDLPEEVLAITTQNGNPAVQLTRSWSASSVNNSQACIFPTAGNFEGAVQALNNVKALVNDQLIKFEQLITDTGSIDFNLLSGATATIKTIKQLENDVEQFINDGVDEIINNALSGAVGKISNPVIDLFGKNNLNGRGGPAVPVAGTAPAGRTYIDRFGILQTLAEEEIGQSADGWVIDSASQNLLPRSRDFDTHWNSNAVSIQLSEAEAGLSVTDFIYELTPDASLGTHNIFDPVTLLAGQVYTFSFAVKPGDYPRLRLQASSNFFSNSEAAVAIFDFADRSVSILGEGSGKLRGPFYNDIYVISLTFRVDISTTAGVALHPDDGSSNLFLGDGVSKYYAGQAQLEPLSHFTNFINTSGAPVARPSLYFQKFPAVNLRKPWTIYFEGDFSRIASTTFQRFLQTSRNGLRFYASASEAGGRAALEFAGSVQGYNGVRHASSIAIVFDGESIFWYLDGDLVEMFSVDVSQLSALDEEFFLFQEAPGVRVGSGILRSFKVYDVSLNASEVKLLSA